MTAALAAFRPRGPRVRGPALDVVPVASEAVSGYALVYDRALWTAPALTDDLAAWWDRLRAVDVPGVAPLVARAPGVFVYEAPPLRLLRELLGRPAGLRAGLELVVSAGALLAARPLGPHAGLCPELLGIDAAGTAWALGWRLPPVDVLWFLDDPAATPDAAAQHAPPERFTGIEEDEFADLYALVAIAAMWITGRPLFTDAAAERARAGEAEHAVHGLGLPGDVAELFSLALSADPAERPDPDAFVEEIALRIATAEGPPAAAVAPEPPEPDSDATAWWDGLFAGDFADDETAPRDDEGAVAVRRAARAALAAEAEALVEALRPLATPSEVAQAEAALDEARAALEADPRDGVETLTEIVGRIAVLRAGVELRRVEEAQRAVERAAMEAENERRLLAARAMAEEVFAAASSEADDCADDPAVAQLLGEIRAGVARTLELSGDGAGARAERALEATRRVRARIGPVAAAARERAAEMRAQAARRAAEELESNLARIAAATRAAESTAERVERHADQLGRPVDRLLPEVADVRDQGRVAAAVAEAAAAQEALAVRVAGVRRMAIEVEFCADPTDAEARLARIAALADEARASMAAIEAAVALARRCAEDERDRKRRAKLAGIREVASARAAEVDPVAAEVEAARIDLAASLEGDPVPPDLRGALATWEHARGAVQAQRDALAEAVELAEAEGPAARLSAAAEAAVVAGGVVVAGIRSTIADRERGREARVRAALERRIASARTEARRSVAAADGSAAAGDRVAAAAEFERLAERRKQVRQGQRDLDAASSADDPVASEAIATALLTAAAELVAIAAEVDAVTAAARFARDPARAERLRRLRRGAPDAVVPEAETTDRREALQASLRTDRPRADDRTERVRAIRRLAGADATEVLQRRSSRPPSVAPSEPDATAPFTPAAPSDDEE